MFLTVLKWLEAGYYISGIILAIYTIFISIKQKSNRPTKE